MFNRLARNRFAWLTMPPAPAKLAHSYADVWLNSAEGIPIKLPWFILALLLAICGVVVAAFIAGEEPYTDSDPDESGAVTRTYSGHGIAHPQFKTMLTGGPGVDRHSNILWLGWAYAVLQALFFVSLLIFGMRKKGEHGPALVPLIVGGAIFVCVFTMLFLSYRGYMSDTDPSLFLTLPKPTAWMIYGIWLFPISFVFIYRRYFDSWFLSDDDMEQFKAILAEHRADDGERV